MVNFYEKHAKDWILKMVTSKKIIKVGKLIDKYNIVNFQEKERFTYIQQKKRITEITP